MNKNELLRARARIINESLLTLEHTTGIGESAVTIVDSFIRKAFHRMIVDIDATKLPLFKVKIFFSNVYQTVECMPLNMFTAILLVGQHWPPDDLPLDATECTIGDLHYWIKGDKWGVVCDSDVYLTDDALTESIIEAEQTQNPDLN